MYQHERRMEQVAAWTKTGSMVVVKEEAMEVVTKEESVEMGEVEMGEVKDKGEVETKVKAESLLELVETKLEVGSDTSSSAIILEWVEAESSSSSVIVISDSEGSEEDPIIKEELGVTLETPP